MAQNSTLVENASTDDPWNIDKISETPVIIKLLGDKPLVWTAEEWLRLQQNRITGNLIGVPANFPRQVAENGVPLLLMPEEVSFILEKKIGKVYRYKKERNFPSEKAKKDYEEYLSKNKEEQLEYYKELCREQVNERIDSIIEGKKRKLIAKKKKEISDDVSEPEIDRDALIESEVERRLSAATSSFLVHIPTASPFVTEQDLEPVQWNFPETPKEKVKYLVYKDLHNRGYCITSGSKFGGDFLAYPGEPWKFHAFFIIKCLEFNEELKCTELIVSTRVGVFTRKNLVIASVDEDESVFYSTFSWPVNRE